MTTSDFPQGHLAGHNDDGNGSNARFSDRSRIEETLVKSAIWKKRTLRKIEENRLLSGVESLDSDTRTARLLTRLSAQLHERNDEVERLRRAITKLENEKSHLGRAHEQELEQRLAELEHMQDAYDQFEKESDRLLSELDRQNERLRDECRHQNSRSLLK